jgi:hypothetical protein
VVRLWHVQNDAAPAQEIKKSDTLWHGISKGSFRSRIKFYPELKKHWFNLFCNVPYKATQMCNGENSGPQMCNGENWGDSCIGGKVSD